MYTLEVKITHAPNTDASHAAQLANETRAYFFNTEDTDADYLRSLHAYDLEAKYGSRLILEPGAEISITLKPGPPEALAGYLKRFSRRGS